MVLIFPVQQKNYTAANGGDYTVVVSNSCGNVTSSVQTVSVQSAPIAGSLTATSSTLCHGDSVLISYSFAVCRYYMVV